MHQEREDLDILFRRTMPEAVLNQIRTGNNLRKTKNALNVSFDKYTDKAYDRYSLLNLPEYSRTEVCMRMEALEKTIDDKKPWGIFSTLVLYADKVLHYDGDNLTCKAEKALSWQSIYLRLGQDIFTTAWLAWYNRTDYQDNMKNKHMTWPAILKTDDVRLNHILERGLAENHFHLHGSTQSFALSWACLMNHPMVIHKFLKYKHRFGVNLNYNTSSGIIDNVMDWEQRVLYAAMIRALLFECCLDMFPPGNKAEDLRDIFRRFDRFPHASIAKEHTEMLRSLYGVKFKQTDKRMVCLDYANCHRFYVVEDNEFNRLLAGERCLLYQCFRRQFRGKATRIESNLLYLYLLIKSNFRGELIQINDRHGFQNFADYQDRKNQLFEKYDEYWTESFRLSVCSGIQENHLVSLETRIMPGMTSAAMRYSIKDIDKRVKFAARRELPFFYVVHFAKKPMDALEFAKGQLAMHPRNYKIRSKTRQQAKALDRFMHKCDYKNQRIWGVDACSMEIGCRPETFATEIRYLRKCSRDNMIWPWYRISEALHKGIKVTYHAGEDFLDIADGLRAVDEAVQFCCMEKGDRIGHGLVLGIDPEEYYQSKRYNIYLRKQDYLDNLVWILYRSLEFGVDIKENVRADMSEKANRMLYEIFGEHISTLKTGKPLELYYRSWKLRGDHPDLYREGKFMREGNLPEKYYDNCKIPGGLIKYSTRNDELRAYRENNDIAGLYSVYHFNNDIKNKGYQVIGFSVDKEYIAIMKSMQYAMRKEIFGKGICIECNPTSNKLIGTFDSYIKHPILGFNNFHLEEGGGHMNIRVSLNTDDLGVFDTSLENEYALMLNAICRQRHENGNYNDDAVYGYLEYLRVSGIDMAFRKPEIGNA